MKYHKLIEGSFSDEEAKDVLKNFFESKIHFHEMRNFSSEERFGHKDPIAVKRIPELKEASEEVLKIVQQAKLSNKRLLINASVQIAIIEE
ncbi:hypothetical protein OAI18_03110 [Flavobacteriaceae bacterium]|nr:hypothetical protein [Flavobacteriaceae bacterium]MDC0107636.1 hypothetical protein [Flavobacteriaceae bacterium]MDC0119620.1 hypothetical protein [Flavobacteriaceae bacterium]MDC1495956.1 hypothetical protein [Flavobacteriaceae bacterium]